MHMQIIDSDIGTDPDKRDYIVSKNPKKIGINTSSYESLADGLSKYNYDQLYNILPSKYKKKVVSAEEGAFFRRYPTIVLKGCQLEDED